MANVTAGAGYSQLKRVGNYISPQINAGADRVAANARQQKQLNAAKEQAANKRLDEAYKGITVDTDALQSKVTGFTNRDDLARDYASVATERSMEYAELAREAAARGDWKTMNTYKGKINRIKGDFKNTVNDEKILAEIFEGYRTKWENGEVDDDDWLAFAESMENFNYDITLDENDNKVIRAIELDDEGKPVMGEDGKPKVMVKKWSEIVNQKDRPYESVQLVDREGKKGLIGDILSNMGKRKYQEATGEYITTTQVWDEEAEAQFQSTVKALTSNDRKMYSLLKKASGGDIKVKNNSKLPAEERNKNEKIVEDFLRDQVKGGYDTEELIAVAGRTPQQMAEEAEKNRDVTRRGQDMTQERADKANELALKKLALDDWKAKNPSAKKPTKTEEAQEASKLAYEIATKIANVEGATEAEKDAAINEIGAEYGLETSANNDWWGRNEFNLGSSEYYQDAPHEVAKAIAKKMGFKYDATYAQKELTKKLDSSKSEDNNPTANMTPQEKIDYYKNLNKN